MIKLVGCLFFIFSIAFSCLMSREQESGKPDKMLVLLHGISATVSLVSAVVIFVKL